MDSVSHEGPRRPGRNPTIAPLRDLRGLPLIGLPNVSHSVVASQVKYLVINSADGYGRSRIAADT